MGTVSEIYASALGASCAECYRKAQRIRELEAQLAAKWISVETNYPRKGESVLVWFGNEPEPYMSVWKYDGTNQYFCPKEPVVISRNQCVTHWQPLPSPPSAVLEANNALAKAALSDGGEG